MGAAISPYLPAMYASTAGPPLPNAGSPLEPLGVGRSRGPAAAPSLAREPSEPQLAALTWLRAVGPPPAYACVAPLLLVCALRRVVCPPRRVVRPPPSSPLATSMARPSSPPLSSSVSRSTRWCSPETWLASSRDFTSACRPTQRSSARERARCKRSVQGRYREATGKVQGRYREGTADGARKRARCKRSARRHMCNSPRYYMHNMCTCNMYMCMSCACRCQP